MPKIESLFFSQIRNLTLKQNKLSRRLMPMFFKKPQYMDWEDYRQIITFMNNFLHRHSKTL